MGNRIISKTLTAGLDTMATVYIGSISSNLLASPSKKHDTEK
jgi:hypothetical protein